MSTARKSISDADALLLYQVGPVYCCSPTLPVESVIMPPRLTHPPGTTSSMPGVFKFSSGIVHVVDLRKRFGVDDEDKREPGRIVIVEVEGGHAGIWVDEIIDVIQFPVKGWGPVPAHIPRNVFSKTLLYDKQIWLYADFDVLHKFKDAGYLRQHIEVLKKKAIQHHVANNSASDKSKVESPVVEKLFVDDLWLDKPDANKHIDHASSAISDINKLDAIQTKQAGLVNKNLVSESQIKTSSTPTKSGNAPEIESGHSSARSKSLETRRVESNVSKPRRPYQGKVNSNISADLSKKESFVKSRSENINVVGLPSRRQTNFTAENGYVENENAASLNASINNVFSDKPEKSIGYSGENNAALWAFSVVIFVMMLVVYFSFDNLFPEKSKNDKSMNPQEVIQDWKVPTAVVEVNNIQSIVGEVSEAVIDIESVSEVAIADNEKTELNDYRADIAHNQNDIVIVLQQPEDEVEVFKDDAMDPGAESLVQQEELVSQKKSENKIESEIDTIEIPEYMKEGKPESIVAVEDKAETTEKSQINSSALASGHETSSSYQVQVILPVSQAIEVQKQVIKKQVIHVVVKGDTLWHIAKRYIKNPYKYPELARLSKIKNPDLIYPGNKVIISIETKKTKKAN